MTLYYSYLSTGKNYTLVNNILYTNNQVVYDKQVTLGGLKGYFIPANYVENAKKTKYYTWFNFDDLRTEYAKYKNFSTVKPSDLDILNGKTILFKDGLYIITVTSSGSGEPVEDINDSGSFYDYVTPIATQRWLDDVGVSVSTKNNPMYRVKYDQINYSIELTLLDDSKAGINYTIPETRSKLVDAPYDMFAIPYNSIKVINTDGNFNTDGSISFNIAMDIARKYSGNSEVKILYDIQLLPYCPMFNIMTSNSGEIDISSLTKDTNYTFITDNETSQNKSIILFPKTSSFSNTIQLDNPIVIQDYKVESETDMYRLCSPNYSGVFEFNAAKNGGIQYFNVNYTYMPYTPYIRVAPNFGRLYKQEFNDNRGLLCGGEFSLPIISDAWETYQLQNKNYQASFDRQISNMEVNNSVQREKEL